MIPNNFAQNQMPQMSNYKEFYQNQMPMPPMNNQGQINPMMQPSNPPNYQINPQMPPKLPSSQPNIISSNFIPNKDFNNRKDMFQPGKPPLNKMPPMQNRLPPHPQEFHHKLDPMSQRSTKIMKMPPNPMMNAPRKVDFFKQSNYRKNNMGQGDSFSDMEDPSGMKIPKFIRPPMPQMNPKMGMQMRKPRMPNMGMEPMKMRQPPFFPNFQMDGGMNPFRNNQMGGFQDPMNEMGEYGFGKNQQKKSTLISTQTFFKTKMCPHLINGNCTKGIKCNYAHSIEEIREPPNLRKTKICQMFTLGKCHLGANCQFAHGELELRSTPNLFKTSLCTVFSKTNSCPHGDKCRYAHGEHDIRPPSFFANQGNQNPNQFQNMGNQEMDSGYSQMNFNPNQQDMPMNFNNDNGFQSFFPSNNNNNNDNLFKSPAGFNPNKIQPNMNSNGFNGNNGFMGNNDNGNGNGNGNGGNNNNMNNPNNNGQGNQMMGGDQEGQKDNLM